MAGKLLLTWSGESEKKLFFLLLVIVAVVGSFMSNTGTVALMLPVVVSIAMSINSSPSKYLIPLSYIGSLSGLMTLIASPPNLIVSQTLVDHGYEKLGFFEITPIGIIAVTTGIFYLYFVRNTLLPSSKSRKGTNNGYQLSPKQLAVDYHLGGNLFRVKVQQGSNLIGKSLNELKIPVKYQVVILKIERNSVEGVPIILRNYQEMAGRKSVIQLDDVLYVQGGLENVERFASDNLLIIKKEESEAEELVSKEFGMAEVLLTPHSSFIRKTIKGD